MGCDDTETGRPAMNGCYSSRKFILALIALIATIGGMFVGKITGPDFYLCLGVVLGSYGLANVQDKAYGGRG